MADPVSYEVYVLFENISVTGKYITNLYTADDNIDTLSDEEIEALSEEIAEDEEEGEQKICIH